MTGRSSHGLERQREALARLAETAQKPILLWSYTLPAQKSVQILSEAGFPLYTDIRNCARTMRVMADYRALRERFLRPIEVRRALPRRTRPSRARAWRRPVQRCASGRRGRSSPATASAPTPSARWRSTAEEAVAAAQAIGGPVALKVQSPDILHKTEAGAWR